jgi:hypothetical protein
MYVVSKWSRHCQRLTFVMEASIFLPWHAEQLLLFSVQTLKRKNWFLVFVFLSLESFQWSKNLNDS